LGLLFALVAAARFTVITHHNAIEAHSARTERRIPASLHASVAEAPPSNFPVGTEHREHREKRPLRLAIPFLKNKWLSDHYGSRRLRISITESIRAVLCMMRLRRFPAARISCCCAEILQITGFPKKPRNSSPIFALL